MLSVADSSRERVLEKSVRPSPLAHRAQEMLRGSPYSPLRAVRCDYQKGVLRLQGQVPTYFLKQLAQTIVLPLDGVDLVVNELTIVGQGRRTLKPMSKF